LIAGSKIAIAGVGALGGTLAASLARAGRTPLLIARGKRLANLRNHGLRYAADGGAEETHHLPVSSAGTAGPQDVLFLATKSDALPQLLPELIDCIQPGTTVIPIVNGIPWWLFADGDQSPIEAVDPGGVLARLIPQDQIIGCVAFLTASLGDDGVVRSHGACRLTVGDVDGEGVDGMDSGTQRARTRQIARTLSAAGIDTTGVDAIRPVLWTKIALNLATNPLSVVAEATLSQQYAHPGLRHAVMGILSEVRSLAAAVGQKLAMTDADMLAAIERAGDFRTSMLQDFDAGRPLELNAIARACLELADRVGIPMPTATILYHLADWRSAHREGDRTRLSTVNVRN
jgi:2-dehydropantoate 2-reductase